MSRSVKGACLRGKSHLRRRRATFSVRRTLRMAVAMLPGATSVLVAEVFSCETRMLRESPCGFSGCRHPQVAHNYGGSVQEQ